MAACAALFLLVLLASGGSAKQITLTLADSTAPTGLRGAGVTALVEEVEKHTNGQVKIQVHWGESLLKEKEILAGVRDGIVDIGYINPNYYPKELLVTGSFALFPQGPRKFTNMYWLYERCFEEIPALKAELEKFKLKPIYTNTVLPIAVTSTKPFVQFDDFKGKRIRAASRWWLGQLKGAGAIPVSIPWGDTYIALQTGTIDGVYTNIDGIHRTKLDEVGKHIFTCRELWVGVPFIYTMNAAKWGSLSPELQKQILKAGEAAAKRYEQLFEEEWNRIASEQKAMGCTITAASAADIGKWAAMPVVDELKREWQKEAEAAGIKDAGEVLAKIMNFVNAAIQRDQQ
jgi:TRAP-type C4-dicarboxylate transport system substrate-binding protein